MRYYILILLTLILTSCGSYTIVSNKQPEIKTLLAVTSAGDTIQVSTDYLYREFNQNPYNYSNWRFYWDNSWYWGNAWFYNYDPYWRYRVYRYNPYRVNPRIRVPNQNTVPLPPRYTPRRVESTSPRGRRTPQVQPNRGRSNTQIRKPNYNTPRTPQRGSNNSTRRGNN